MTSHFYRPAEGHGLPHDPFNAIVAPRPIGWIGTRSSDGTHNLAPYSFFNALNYTPPMVGFSSIGHKHTVANCEETGEFTWNLVTRTLAAQMNSTSTQREVDEFEAAGLTAIEGTDVTAPRVAESPVCFECKVTDVRELTDLAGDGVDSWFTVGQVVAVHLDTSLLVDGVFSTALADPALRAGGPATYFGITADDIFELRRPD